MDNFDEFEFKPITEGLGFHKKNQKPRLDISDAVRAKTIPTAPGSGRVQTQFSKVTEDFVPESSKRPAASRPVPQSTPMQKPRSQPNYRINPNTEFIDEQKNSKSEPTRSEFSKEEIPVAFASIFFDSIVIVGLTGLFLFVTFLIARVDPLKVIKMIPSDPMTAVGVGVLVFSLIQGYLLVSRSFFGSTLGEWAFEIEVGTQEEQASAFYPLRILWRSFLTILTGLVVLPLLSVVLGEDVGGRLSGVYLQRGQ